MDDQLRMAGSALGLDVREGLANGSLSELRRAMRADKLIPRSLMQDFHAMAPEHSEPGYSLRGQYQPEVAYGA